MSNLYIDLENKLKLDSSVSARSRIARREQAAAQVWGFENLNGFFKITSFLDRFLTEHIDMKNSL